jgi:hypothetical protein
VAPTEMLPGLHNTFALPKKNAGKSQKVNKGKTSPEVEDDVKTAPVEKKTPETVETNGDVIDTVVAKGKKGRGKKPGKKEVVEENHLNGVVSHCFSLASFSFRLFHVTQLGCVECFPFSQHFVNILRILFFFYFKFSFYFISLTAGKMLRYEIKMHLKCKKEASSI